MKNLNFLFVALVVVLFSVVFTSCSNEHDDIPQIKTELIGVENGNSSEGGIWSMATFCNPLLTMTRAYYVVISEDSTTYEFYFETTSNEFLVLRIFADAETSNPLVASFMTTERPQNAIETDNFGYQVSPDNTSAEVILDYQGIRVKGIVSLVKEK